MIAPELLEVVRPLAEAFAREGRSLFLVGGIVRDDLLHHEPSGSDLDCTTDARPDEIKRIVAPLASAVWTQGERFGTIGCRIGAHPYEITTFRGEAYDPSSRKPTVVFADALAQDLARRDFTINAMAVDARTGALHDPFGGRDDLAARVLRTPSGADVSFSDDPLRMLRAARFLARFDLTPAPDLDAAIVRTRERLAIVSVERVREELHKLLLVPDPTRGLRFLLDHGLLDEWLPELRALAGVADDAHGEPDVLAHTFAVVRDCPVTSPVVRLAALVHDIGKVDGVEGHVERGTELAAARLDRLRHTRHEVRDVRALVALHHRLQEPSTVWDPPAVRAMVVDASDLLDDLVVLTRANAGARDEPTASVCLAALDAFVAAHRALGEGVADLEPELDGAQVMAVLGIGPGPAVGRALAHLRAQRLADGTRGVEAATAELRAWWARETGG